MFTTFFQHFNLSTAKPRFRVKHNAEPRGCSPRGNTTALTIQPTCITFSEILQSSHGFLILLQILTSVRNPRPVMLHPDAKSTAYNIYLSGRFTICKHSSSRITLRESMQTVGRWPPTSQRRHLGWTSAASMLPVVKALPKYINFLEQLIWLTAGVDWGLDEAASRVSEHSMAIKDDQELWRVSHADWDAILLSR